MACYTLSDCILHNLNAGKKYITDLLMVFTQEANPFKVALDKSNRIIDLYELAGQENEYVANWLSLMSFQPCNFETINIDTSTAMSNEEIFLKVCDKTNSQQKLIVYSHEGWQNFNYHSDKVIIYDTKPITVLDRDEAIHDLHQTTSSQIMAFNSIIATNQSTITNSNNS